MTRKVYYTPVPNKRCVGCDVDLGTTKKIQEHCTNPECVRAWALREIDRKCRRQGDCLIWTGAIRKGDVAYQSIYTSVGERRDMRVLDVLNPDVSRSSAIRLSLIESSQIFLALLGTEQGALPAHHLNQNAAIDAVDHAA